MAEAVTASGAVRHGENLRDQLVLEVSLDALPVARALADYPVRNVGPQRIQQLGHLARGELSRILRLDAKQVAKAVGQRQVAGVRESIQKYLGSLTKEQAQRQLKRSAAYPTLHEVIEPLLRTAGTAFESPVAGALNLLGWDVRQVEQAGHKGQPDLTGLDHRGAPVVVECKTSEDLIAEVSRKEATEVRKKGTGRPNERKVTVGKPVFSHSAIEFAYRQGPAHNLHLVTAGAVVELLLLVQAGELDRQTAAALLTFAPHVAVAAVRTRLRLA